MIFRVLACALVVVLHFGASSSVAQTPACPSVFIVDGEVHQRDALERLQSLIKKAGIPAPKTLLFQEPAPDASFDSGLASEGEALRIAKLADEIVQTQPPALVVVLFSAFSLEGSDDDPSKTAFFLDLVQPKVGGVIVYTRAERGDPEFINIILDEVNDPELWKANLRIVGNWRHVLRWSEEDHDAVAEMKTLVRGFAKDCKLPPDVAPSPPPAN